MMRYALGSFAICILSAILFSSCAKDEPENFLFEQLPSSHTNIVFSNELEDTPEFNIQNYLYFYDGGGVAVGDINNNGLPDLFFTGNMVENRLYLNKGDFVFEDITEQAGIINDPGSWSTGVTMADVNGNGYLDIYVSRVTYLTKSGANQLFINNGDGTFTERAAEFGLNFEGYSTQAAFFDYNSNGRLDMFLLNHTFHGEDTYGQAEILRQRPHPRAGDRLFRNDGGRFTDVTEEAGIYSSALGYGLGVAITDINQNGWPDIYVGNDFHEDDYFYINNGDGTFTESLYSMVGHTSNSSMGNDVGDINNNGRMDIVSLDMMPEDHEVFLKSGGPDLMVIYQAKKNFGFGEKNHRNTLQINRGIPEGRDLPVFSETAFASGIAKTEWSWASLFADFDNDGFNDLYITNGMPRRPNDLDYVARLGQLRQQFSGQELEEREFELIERMPVVNVPNYMFKNNGDLTFSNVTQEWGFGKPAFSSGAVYADLNNNGMLDLVVNNTNAHPFLYRNTTQPADNTNYLKVKLNGDTANTTGIGSKLFLYNGEQVWYREQMPTRGFQSSVDHVLHVGLGSVSQLDSVMVIWPDHRYQVLTEVEANQAIVLNQTDARGEFDYSALHQRATSPLLRDITGDIDAVIRHRENSFDDFHREPLMPYKQSTRGPALAVADVTGNGLDDIFIGGSRSFSGTLWLQQSAGQFVESNQTDFLVDRGSEDVAALFFDANGNGLPDLYVVSGGNELTGGARELLDRLYINMGDGNFQRSANSLPDIAVNGSTVAAADMNGNGHLDLFIGGHTIPWRYGVAPQSVLLENNGDGTFTDVTDRIAPEIQTIGNITAAGWIQNPETDLPDLIIAGEWMPIHYFKNQGGRLEKQTDLFELQNEKGLWQSIHIADLTGNGYDDIVLGNFGINSRLQASSENPITLYINDFEGDGQTDPLITVQVNGEEKPFEQLDELIAQIPSLSQQVRSYQDFAGRSIGKLIDPQKRSEALVKQITGLESVILLNNGNGIFTIKNLPFEAQWFPVMAIHSADVTGDGHMDLLLAGNIYEVKPSMGGRQDAGYGLLLTGDGTGNFIPNTIQQSGFFAKGAARSIQPVNLGNGEPAFIVALNNDRARFYIKQTR